MSLFPSANATTEDASSSKPLDQGLEWLANKSYTADTAKKLLEFQDELNVELKTYESVCDGATEVQPVQTVLRTEGEKTQITESAAVVKDRELGKTKYLLYKKSSPVKDSSEGKKHKKGKRHSPSFTEESDSPVELSYDEGKHLRKRKKSHYAEESCNVSYDLHKSKSVQSDDRRRRRKKKRKKMKKTKHNEYKESERETHKAESQFGRSEQSLRNEILPDGVEIPVRDAFTVDRTPDLGSWTYGSLYNTSVPHYNPLVHSCMGRGRNQYIGVKNHQEKKRNAEKEGRYFSKANRTVIKQSPEAIFIPNAGKLGSDSNALFVEFEEKGNINKEQKDAQTTSSYIQGKVQERQGTDENVKQAMDSVRLSITDFNRQLREDPQNVALWLEFVKFQDLLNIAVDDLSIQKSDNTKFAKQISQSRIIDKKLLILENALTANPGNVELLLAKLYLKSESLEPSQINKEFEQLLSIHPANTSLWKQYLTYNQSTLSVFSVTRITKYYHKCFKTLSGVLDGKFQTHSIREDLDKDLLDIFLQYCYLLRQTSHKERALAILQAMTEYNLFCPLSLKSVAKETKMAAFEDFWECNCARVGIEGARGWNKWLDSASKNEIKVTKSQDTLEEIEEDIIESKGSKDRTWLTIEALRDMHHWFPWQPDTSAGETGEDCADVERLVLFDDVAPALFSIPRELNLSLIAGIVNVLIGNKQQCETLHFKGSTMSCENLDQVMFQTQIASERQKLSSSGVISKELRNFVINLLKMSVPCFTGEERTELTLLLIRVQLSLYSDRKVLGKRERKEMRAVVKNALKVDENRNNLSIWVSYVNLETQIGKAGEALSIIEMALAIHSGKPIDNLCKSVIDMIHLFGMCAEVTLNMKKQLLLSSQSTPVSKDARGKVVYSLNCLMNSERVNSQNTAEVSGSVVLRTSSMFSRKADMVLKQIENKHANATLLGDKLVQLLWCYSLFQYCALGFHSSQSVFSKYLNILQSSVVPNVLSCLEEKLLTNHLRLILHHMATSSLSLHVLRDCLDLALEKYPNNPDFLGLFVDVEKKSRISGRLNRYFDKWCRRAVSHIPVVFAVHTQLQFLQDLQVIMDSGDGCLGLGCSSGKVHRTRCWLETCLSRPELRHCPLLWKLYLQLERLAGTALRMKGVFYRAIQECPWVKSLYVLGVELFGEDQLPELVDLMTEKELRVQLPLEELNILMR